VSGAHRLRGHSGTRPESEFMFSCLVCNAPMPVETRSPCCSDECRQKYRLVRRKARSVECLVRRVEGGPTVRKWLPKRLAPPPHIGMCELSGAARGPQGERG